MGVCELGYLGFQITDREKWQRLATRVLGLQSEASSADGVTYLRCDERHHRIALHPGATNDLHCIGWQAPSASAFDALVARLVEAKVDLQDATDEELAVRKVVRMVHFRDPGGYPCELFHSPLVLTGKTFQPSRPMSGFRTGPLGLGHVLGYAENVAEMERFYVGVLGFKVSDYGLRGSVFMRCNPRHHTFAVSPSDSGARISHLMIEAMSIDDVGRAMDLCESEGIPIVTTLGRHTNDHMVSFYLETPSGFHLEYGCQGRLVDDAAWAVHVNESGDLWGHRRVREKDRQAHRLDPTRTPYAHMMRNERAVSQG